MTDNEIFQLTEKFRSAILRSNVNGEFFRDGFIELFPRGNCGIVCNLLGRYFLEYTDVRSWYTFGETKSESHVWLTLENGSIVDITGNQYSNRTGALHYDLPVYVGQIDAFHKQFRLNGEPLEITPDDWPPISWEKPVSSGKANRIRENHEVCRLSAKKYKTKGDLWRDTKENHWQRNPYCFRKTRRTVPV